MRQLEDQGKIRGGWFVSGSLGEQFGLKLAVGSLRATRNLAETSEAVTVSAADPLNLVGIVGRGARASANSG
jgi:ATP-dependent Lhr-like helicase